MGPAAIDLTFIPSPRAGLHTIAAGSELLIVDERTDQVHLLSPTATLAWSFADGHGSLADFAADLADGLGAAPDVVATDLVILADELVGRGLWRAVHEPVDLDEVVEVDVGAGPAGADRVRRVEGRPSPGLDARFAADRVQVLTVRRRSVELDLRVDDPGLAADLAGDLTDAGLEVVGRPARDVVRPAPPLYSVLIGRRSGPVTGLHLVHRTDRPIRRCRHRDDLARIVVAELVAVLDREAGRRPLLDAVGLVRDDRMVAVDPLFSSVVDDLEARFRRDGIRRADASLIALGPCDPPFELAALVLRPAADPSPGAAPLDPEARAGRIAVRAVDLARGPARHVSAGCVERLYDVARTAPVVRVPGRGALRAEVLARLS